MSECGAALEEAAASLSERGSRSSRYASASSSVFSRAYIISDARIFLARVYICFSPVERPLSCSRTARLRTTSASS